MPRLSRVNDTTINNGRILLGAPTVIAEGRPVGIHVSPITPHPKGKPHAVSKTIQGSATVRAQGKPVLYVGCMTTCFHPIQTGCARVIVGS